LANFFIFVIPAKAGTQLLLAAGEKRMLGPGLRRDDDGSFKWVQASGLPARRALESPRA
jgi:hypothetical protein